MIGMKSVHFDEAGLILATFYYHSFIEIAGTRTVIHLIRQANRIFNIVAIVRTQRRSLARSETPTVVQHRDCELAGGFF